jgi:hypothetical protein
MNPETKVANQCKFPDYCGYLFEMFAFLFQSEMKIALTSGKKVS